jgi:hypothetical protein
MQGHPEKNLPDIIEVSGELISEKQRSPGHVSKLLHDRYFWYIVVLAVFIGIFSYAPDSITLIGLGPVPDWELPFYVALYRSIFILSIAIAAWRFRTSGGIVTAILLALIIFSPLIFGLRELNIWLELGLIILGILTSLLIGRQGNMQRLLARTAVELQQQTTQLKQEMAERKRAEEEFRVLSLRAIESLVFALEAKDKYSAGHSRRVADIAIAIGRRMNLPADDLEDLRCSSLLHDVGKIAVEQFIQNKPGALTPEEYKHVMIHVQAGADIVKLIVNEKVVKLIEHHHDHYDGGHLHQVVAGEVIPLGARIIAIADAFDAMTSDRPYRSTMSAVDAKTEIQKCIGTQFDPVVVGTFLKIPMSDISSTLE